MTTFFRTTPTYEVPISTGKNTTSAWYRWFQSIHIGTPPSSEKTIAVPASPFLYTAPSKGFVIVNGGTVSQIQFSRTPGVFYVTGQTSGTFPVSANDQLKIIYSGVPSVVFVSQ